MQQVKKVFSGIQPTGDLHIGNYLGAIRRWVDLQNSEHDVTYCIVDLHSITLRQNPVELRDNSLRLCATLLACGIDPSKATLFLQSSVKEHSELCWILGCITTMARLTHLPQYKEKSAMLKEIPLGLYLYPVLQAADIMLYKWVPCPPLHSTLSSHFLNPFQNNSRSRWWRSSAAHSTCATFGEEFQQPIWQNVPDVPTDDCWRPEQSNQVAARSNEENVEVRSRPKELLNANWHSGTNHSESQESDHRLHIGSDLWSGNESRRGKSFDDPLDGQREKHSADLRGNEASWHWKASLIDGAKLQPWNLMILCFRYKFVVAEALVEHLSPIRLKIEDYLKNPEFLSSVLADGADRARETAEKTIDEVKLKVGLGQFNGTSVNVLKHRI